MVSKFPPKGYTAQQYPLTHNFNYQFSLAVKDVAQNSYMATILRYSNIATGVEAVEVNPGHASYLQDTGPLCYLGSIIPRVNIKMTAWIDNDAKNQAYSAGATGPIHSAYFKWMPIYGGFLEAWTPEDLKTGTKVSDILQLTTNATQDDVVPTHDGNNNDYAQNHPLSAVAHAEDYADYGLSVNAIMEDVDYNDDTFWDAMQFYSNGPALRKVTGKWRHAYVKREGYYKHHSNKFAHPNVKRINPYTYCGILFHMPTTGQFSQLLRSDETGDVQTVNVDLEVYYEEWNPEFDQTRD